MGEVSGTLPRTLAAWCPIWRSRKKCWLIAIESPVLTRRLVRAQQENGSDPVFRLRSENIPE
jgi:hypothetical protein